MRYILGFAVIVFGALSSFGVPRQVHYYSAGGSVALGFHYGASAIELRQSWEEAGFIATKNIPACPFYPASGHYGGANYSPTSTGLEGVYIMVNGSIYYGQHNWHIGTLNNGTDWALQKCSGCGNVGFLIHKIQTLADSNPANADWIWNGAREENEYIKNFTFTFDSSGNINGYNAQLDLPFGGYESNVELGIVGNGSFSMDSVTGPKWVWAPGVTPPINPDIISGIGESLSNVEGILTLSQDALSSLATSGELSALTLSSVLDSLELLNASQIDYSSDFGAMLLSLDEIAILLASSSGGGSVSSNVVDSSAVVAELLNVELLLLGDEIEVEDLLANAGLVSAHDSLIGALNPVVMKAKVEALSASGELLKNTVNSLFGDWKALARDKPVWVVDFTIPVGGKNYKFVWNSADKIPDDWWLYVRILRNAEVIGLSIWLLMSLSKLLHKTFGGAA